MSMNHAVQDSSELNVKNNLSQCSAFTFNNKVRHSFVPNCRGGRREGGQIANFGKKPSSSFNYYKRMT